MFSMIGIVDYGMGNLFSVSKALERLGAEYFISANKKDLLQADGLILPGVGSFRDAMERLPVETIKEFVATGKPLLGICLGMQLLFGKSEEYGEHIGLGLLSGEAVRFRGDFKVPHMGWNELQVKQQHSLLEGVQSGDYVYFVHSYHVHVGAPEVLLATTDYHQAVTAIVGRDNVFGMQFHPEKSGETGMRLLSNFAVLCEEVLA